MARAAIKKDVEVTVISGSHRGKAGPVQRVDRTRGFVWVKGVNVGKKAVRRSQENPRGGFIEIERPIHISNVMPTERWTQRRQKHAAVSEGKN
jgi:large subunit ribosomal protein L24